MDATILIGLYIFVLACFAGAELIAKVPQTLHTPLMSGANAISGIAILGALLAAGNSSELNTTSVVGILAVIFATINVVGGYMVTDRMLQMFKKKKR
jgi:NAD(P) transhydrogenase subunit alpha